MPGVGELLAVAGIAAFIVGFTVYWVGRGRS